MTTPITPFNSQDLEAACRVSADTERGLTGTQIERLLQEIKIADTSPGMTKWTRRAEVRHRPPYQTRHTYACWNLTARGNLAFIADQMGHSDYSMLVKVYGCWIDSESPRELGRIWQGMKKLVQIAPNLPQ